MIEAPRLPVSSLAPGSESSALESGVSHGLLSGLDLDELFFVAAAVLPLCGGAVVLLYVIYAAPLLLAEVALDAALVSSVWYRLRREDAGSWAGAVLRHTLAPAMALIVFVGLAGFALQHVAPDARSIGGVLRALTG